MKKTRIAVFILLSAMLLPCLISCSRLSALRGGKADTAKYVNSDYHFTLVYPSYFNNIVEIPSEENGDEYRIEFKHGNDDKDLIYVDINYKTAEDLYEFTLVAGLDKNKISPLTMSEFEHSVNSIAYDNRDCPAYEKPSYYIYAMTKKMLYTVGYEFERSDKNADEFCNVLKFEFDIYANVPKENQFLSAPIQINKKTSSLCVPANYTVRFYPLPDSAPQIKVNDDTGEVIYPDYSSYRRIEAYSDIAYFILDLPQKTEYDLQQLATDEPDEAIKASLEQLCGDKFTSVVFEETGQSNSENSVTYRKIYFTCLYNGKPASGTVSVGFTSGFRYYKAVYLIINGVPGPEEQCYNDMLHSLKLG